MKSLKGICTGSMAAGLILGCSSFAKAQLYSENFVGTGSLTTVGWSDTSVEAGFAGLFDHSGEGVTNEATTPDGVDAGAVFHYISVNGTRAITTTEFAPISTGGAGVDIVWYQTEDALVAGSTVDVHPAVMVGGQWYASKRAYSTVDVTSPWQRFVLPYSSAAANWRQLTLGAGSASLSAAPASNLSGDIAGLGLVTVMTNALIGNETVWYDYIEISTHLTPGDVNGVGGVTIDDFTIIKNNYLTAATLRTQGDLNRDGIVDVLDFREWKANFGGAFSAAQFPIPEPASAVLAVAAIGLTARRRRVRSGR